MCSSDLAYKMLKQDYAPTFTLTNLKKDLDTINEAAKAFGVTLPMASRANQIYQDAEKKYGTLDYTAILEYLSDSN